METTQQISNWSSEQDEILIDFVRTHEALYNVKSPGYRKMQVKQTLWGEVGTILGKTGNDCNKRWAYIRDYYIRKRGKPTTRSAGEAAKKRSELLSFLDNCPSVKRNNIQCDEANQNLDEDISDISELVTAEEESLSSQSHDDITLSEGSSQKLNDLNTTSQTTKLYSNKKKKASCIFEPQLEFLEINHRPHCVEVVQDETDLFFASMAKIVRKLPPQEQARLRMEICTKVGNAELTFYNQNGPSASPKPSTSNE